MADERGVDMPAQQNPPADEDHADPVSPWSDLADVAPMMLVLRLWTEARAVARSVSRVEPGVSG